MKKYIAASLAVFVCFVIWDNYLGNILLGPVVSKLPGVVENYSKMWEMVGDLLNALVLVGVYARTRTVFGEGAQGGAVYGTYAGVLANFPIFLSFSNYFAWPYRSAWIMTIVFTCFYIAMGAVAGWVYQLMGGAKKA